MELINQTHCIIIVRCHLLCQQQVVLLVNVVGAIVENGEQNKSTWENEFARCIDCSRNSLFFKLVKDRAVKKIKITFDIKWHRICCSPYSAAAYH